MVLHIALIKLKRTIYYHENNSKPNEIKTYVKESRFSYIIPIHGSIFLIVYNSSNVTSMEGRVHRTGKVVVEVPEGCMIVFTNNTFYAGVKIYVKHGGNHSSHLRLFAYIVEDKYTSIMDSIDKSTNAIECDTNCLTYESIVNDNIHYERHIIRYLQNQCEIDNSNMGTFLIEYLTKVG